MKKGDILWGAALLAVVAFLAYGPTRELFEAATASQPYVMGFLKFAILATMGELLAVRIVKGEWEKPSGLAFRAFIWGFLGVVIVLIFKVFAGGVLFAQANGFLPTGHKILFAFFTSALMNMTFAPTMMGFHRITDTYIDLKTANKPHDLSSIVAEINWDGYVKFVLLKTIPIFWIPAHTITFLLPTQYQVLMAGFLSIALGAILAFAKRR